MRVIDSAYKAGSAYFLPRHGVWTDGGMNHYEVSNYKYHPVLNAILNSVVVTAVTAKMVTFNVTIRSRTYTMAVRCSAVGNARIGDEAWDSPLYVRLRRVLWTCVDLKVNWSMEIFESFMIDATEDAVASRKLAA